MLPNLYYHIYVTLCCADITSHLLLTSTTLADLWLSQLTAITLQAELALQRESHREAQEEQRSLQAKVAALHQVLARGGVLCCMEKLGNGISKGPCRGWCLHVVVCLAA